VVLPLVVSGVLSGMNLGNLIAILLVTAVFFIVLYLDHRRRERGWVDLSSRNDNPMLPDPNEVAIEEQDKQNESEDGKKKTRWQFINEHTKQH